VECIQKKCYAANVIIFVGSIQDLVVTIQGFVDSSTCLGGFLFKG
jgi:hypothetical protein